MQAVMKKLYMSILASMLVLITTVVTTYAWAGFLNYSTTERFYIGLEENVDPDFKIQISTDGINFGDYVTPTQIKRSILKNMEYSSEIDNLDDEKINRIFEDMDLLSLTTQRKGNSLGSFVCLEEITKYKFQYDFNSVESEDARKAHYDFDLYLSFEYKDPTNVSKDVVEQLHKLYLCDVPNILTGKNQTTSLTNEFKLDNYFKDTVFKTVTVNSASAARVALSKYPVVDKGNPTLYDGVDPIDLTIYQGGTALPTEKDGVYSFGGMLGAQDNIGFLYYNQFTLTKIKESMLDEFIDNRGEEVPLAEQDYGYWIVDENDGLTVQKMIKFNVQMWVEGFDADCFKVIADLPIDLNLTFSTTVGK